MDGMAMTKKEYETLQEIYDLLVIVVDNIARKADKPVDLATINLILEARGLVYGLKD